MLNQVLWAIDNELSGHKFERLCVDLLFRNGYRQIVPIEPQDAGRDAEEYSTTGQGHLGELCFFQFSLETNWKSKLRRDMHRVYHAGHTPSRFVFVTSQLARGIDRDSIARDAMNEYGWEVIIYSREWLRLQLEEAHPDLARKYLGVNAISQNHFAANGFPRDMLAKAGMRRVQALFDSGAFEQASVELREMANRNSANSTIYEALAWSQYQTYQYDEAMISINRAIKLSDTIQARSIRACILTERGIQRGDRASVIEARDIFKSIVEQGRVGAWVDHYNLGRSLSALGVHAQAVEHYVTALEFNPNQVQIWTNLANTYHLIGECEKEMECLDKALSLDPARPEALASKGVSLLNDFGKPVQAAVHLEKAVAIDNSMGFRWPHVWYWLAEAYLLVGQLREALQCVDDGLQHQPGFIALRSKKSELLETLVEQNSEHDTVAESFWRSMLELEPRDFSSRRRLVLLLSKRSLHVSAWNLADESFLVFEMLGLPSLEASGYSIEAVIEALEELPLYYQFRDFRPISEYWHLEERSVEAEGYPPWAATIEPRLKAYLAIPFGQLISRLQTLKPPSADVNKVRELLDVHANGIVQIITESSRELASLIPRDKNSEEKAKAIANILTFLGFLGLLEASAQVGFIIGHFSTSMPEIKRALDTFPFADIQKEIMVGCLGPLNDEASFAPK